MQNKHDPAVITAALAGLEAALARAVALAPESRLELQAMAGTLLAVELTQPEVVVYVRINDSGDIALASYCEEKPVTRVKGPLESFVSLATADDPAAMLINSDIEVIGNTAPLLSLQAIIANMNVDWEAPLVAGLGDVAGHQLAEVLRSVFTWGGHAAGSLRRQLSEFILEEGRLSPPALELEDFYTQVQSLSLRVDRLESRARRLAQRLAGFES